MISVNVIIGNRLVKGPAGVVIPALKAARIRKQWDPDARGWIIPPSGPARDDFMYVLEQRIGADQIQVVAK